VILPCVLSILATLAAALMAYGVHPGWVHYSWGLGLIMIARRLQWPLIALSLVMCIALLGLVISGKRRVWWLIGLAPVLTLFGHRFLTAPTNRYAVVDEPTFVAADQAKQVRDDDMIVGVVFNERPYAYPYSVLYYEPVVVQSDREKRLLLMWNAYASMAAATPVTREIKARELDIVCDPADSLLVYNGRTGQFIVGLTGRSTDGGRASGTEVELLPVAKMTWRRWRTEHPDTKVMIPAGGKLGPATPLTRPGDARVVLVGSTLAVREDEITVAPLNVTAGDVPAVVFRDKTSGRVVAFDRRVEKDLIPRFTLNHEPRRKVAFMIDSDTRSGWNAEGVAVDGPDKHFNGRKLSPLEVQEDVSWSAASHWLRELKLHETPTTKPAS
jgi:hypothetical protein